VASDVGHRLDVVVTASNAVGSVQAASAPTAPVSAGQGGGGCFAVPSSCGLPDQSNTGPEAGVSLVADSGQKNITTPGSCYCGKRLVGSLNVEAENVRIENDEIEVLGSCGAECYGDGITLKENSAKGSVIQHVSVHGGAASGVNALAYCIHDENGQVTVRYVSAYWCSNNYSAGGTWEHDYMISNATVPGAHYEPMQDAGGGYPLFLRHDTFLNPHNQTAAVLLGQDYGGVPEVREEENLVAGGGYPLYGGGGPPPYPQPVGPIIIKNNRFARCLGKVEAVAEGYLCHGLAPGQDDGHGYYPMSGSSWPDVYFKPSVTHWEGNTWDDNGQPLTSP
jgi:hypothetical protein